MYILEKNVEIQMNEEWSSISFSAGVLIKSERSLSNLIKIRLLNPFPTIRYTRSNNFQNNAILERPFNMNKFVSQQDSSFNKKSLTLV